LKLSSYYDVGDFFSFYLKRKLIKYCFAQMKKKIAAISTKKKKKYS